jgi:hypothetical protein
MTKKYKAWGLAVVIFSILGNFTSATADTNTSWAPLSPHSADANFHAVYYEDSSPLRFDFSLLQGLSPIANNEANIITCKATSDPKCAGMGFIFNSILKACATPTETDCIASVDSIDAAGKSVSGSFKKYTVVNHVNAYPADLKLGIPAGGMPSVWELSGATHGSSADYVVEAGVAGEFAPGGRPSRNGTYLSVNLKPVNLKDFGKGPQSQDGGWGNLKPDYFYDACTVFQQTPTHTNVNCGHVNGETCLYPTEVQGQCYVKEEFPADIKFKINLRLSQEPNGWLHGRMSDPNVAITKLVTGGVELSVSAGVTSVPMAYQGADWTELTPEVQKFWVDCWAYGPNCGVGQTHGSGQEFNDYAATLDGNNKVNLLIFPMASGALALQGMTAINKMNGDKATASSRSWSFRSLSNYEMNGADRCFTSTPGIKGIVTTNSTTYSAGPPALIDGSLNYKVASPHFNPDGTVFKGNYNLVIKSDVARCLYGFSKAPVNATISITSADGTPQLATTVVGEKDGWIYLKASNFEFSAPTVQVKLTQDAPATSTQSTAAKKKSMSITCIKGKAIKVVSSGVCPGGFKRK